MSDSVRHLLHHLTHRHWGMSKPGIGSIELCSRRLSKYSKVWFLPEHESACYRVYGTTEEVVQIAKCENSHEALTLVAQLAVKAGNDD